MLQKSFFGTDGIRGRANTFPIDPQTALKVGLAVGSIFYASGSTRRVVIGKDTRLSGYMIESALVAGLTAMGMDVFLLGPLPTPAVSMLVRSLRADLGIMISASHNPFEDNGLKFFGPTGHKFCESLEKDIEERISSDLSEYLVTPMCVGRAKRVEDARARYMEYVKSSLGRSPSLEGMRVVLDCANGAAYKTAPEILWELGACVTTIHNQPNGFNINDQCGSTNPESLQKAVREAGAQIGLALDGDADRLVVVDEEGEVVLGDHLLGCLAMCLQNDGLLTSRSVVGTILSNFGLETYLHSLGLSLLRTDVGDRNVMECMLNGGHTLGGEPSGHIMLGNHTSTGDGLLASVQLLSYLKRSGQPVSQFCRPFYLVPQRNFNLSFEAENLPREGFLQQLSGEINQMMGSQGRFIVRQSGTQAGVVRVSVETEDKALCQRVCEKVADTLKVRLEI